MWGKLKALLERGPKPLLHKEPALLADQELEVDAAAAEPMDVDAARVEPPISLVVGSLAGSTKKEAEAYARGVADSLLTSVELGKLRVLEDKAGGRMIYEIHEGGSGLSVLERVVQDLDRGMPVNLALADGRYVQMDHTHGQIFSLIVPEGERDFRADQVHPVSDYAGDIKLTVMHPDRNGLAGLGGAMLGLSFVAFLVVGALFTVVKSGVLEKDVLVAYLERNPVKDPKDNPAWQMEQARAEAQAQGKTLNTLRRDATGWKWDYQ